MGGPQGKGVETPGCLARPVTGRLPSATNVPQRQKESPRTATAAQEPGAGLGSGRGETLPPRGSRGNHRGPAQAGDTGTLPGDKSLFLPIHGTHSLGATCQALLQGYSDIFQQLGLWRNAEERKDSVECAGADTSTVAGGRRNGPAASMGGYYAHPGQNHTWAPEHS